MEFYWVPARDARAASAELNAALRTRRVIAVERRFCGEGPDAGWALCVEFAAQAEARPDAGSRAGRGGSVDYRHVLPPETFALFAALRAWRKDTAGKEGVPPYAILTNEQMAQAAERRCKSVADLEGLAGFGPARAKKYAASILDVLAHSAVPVETASGADGA